MGNPAGGQRRLTDMEWKVLELLAQGYTYDQIAFTFSTTVAKIRSHEASARVKRGH